MLLHKILALGCLTLICIQHHSLAFTFKIPSRDNQLKSNRRYSSKLFTSTSSIPSNPTTASETFKGERTKQILDEITSRASEDSSGGAGSSISFKSLEAMDRVWQDVKTGRKLESAPSSFVRQRSDPLSSAPEYDVVVCGGTLGVFIATILQLKGFKVCIVERGPLSGRTQEWNISRKELVELVEYGILDEEELDEVIGIDFNPIRVGFTREEGEYAFFTKDVLHLGVFPRVLVEKTKQRFLKAGGVVYENTSISGVTVAPNGAQVEINEEEQGVSITSRLVIDCMGNQSPISRQARQGQKPDGICIVVGTMASGYNPANNTFADLMYSTTPTLNKGPSQVQYFWEAFPAASGPGDRTTYMFMYCDASPERPSILECWEDYWEFLPQYQGVKIEDLTFKRALCNFFPTYKASPLQTDFDRLCAIGDASGIQSPLSFGGFGALTRHLSRLVPAFTEALEMDCLSREDLKLINGYQPSLSVAWLFQRSMQIPIGANPQPYFINKLLSSNFQSMVKLGDPVLKPFLQDVVQAEALFKALSGIVINDPLNTPSILFYVGLQPFLEWMAHFSNLVLFTVLYRIFGNTKESKLPPTLRYRWNRYIENWQYGSGMDFKM